ncbi:hypothetical protein [Micropruina sp.]|uniref:hypothetical protein n=1 Tax=Micropruina sp. TaxID=2737536 RepID=UPI0039E49655
MSAGPLPLTSSYSHLFRGVRLSVPRAAVALPLGPADVRLAFSDGIEVAGELLATSADADLVLSISGYRTAAGQTIDAALWPVSEVADDADPELLTLRLGQRIR